MNDNVNTLTLDNINVNDEDFLQNMLALLVKIEERYKRNIETISDMLLEAVDLEVQSAELHSTATAAFQLIEELKNMMTTDDQKKSCEQNDTNES